MRGLGGVGGVLQGLGGGSWGCFGGGPAADVASPSAVICHVVGITYQHIDRWLLAEMLGDLSGKGVAGRGWGGGGVRLQPPVIPLFPHPQRLS